MRLGQIFLEQRKKTLKDMNYITDSGTVSVNHQGELTFYHYTHEDRVPMITAEGSGLRARRKVVCSAPPEELEDSYLVEGFLSPLPKWLTTSSYYGDLGMKLTEKYIGNVLLQITMPAAEFSIYIADYAHILECKMPGEYGHLGMGFGYDCSNGGECTQAYVNSYIPIEEYVDQHHAPIVQVVRKGEGIVVPSHYIKISEHQPRK